MQYRKLANSDLTVSVVGLGTWAIGNDFFGATQEQESIAAIQQAIDSGINLIDTAPAYGDGYSESIVGKAIQNRRENLVIATKVGILRHGSQFIINLTPESVSKEIDDSLRRLQIDYIDLYQIHWPDPKTAIELTMESLVKIYQQGKFRYLGVSNFKPDLIEKVRQFMPVISCQPHYSLLERNIEKQLLPYCRQNDIAILSYGTLGGGILSGKFETAPQLPADDLRDSFYRYYSKPVWQKIQPLLQALRDIATANVCSVSQAAIHWTIMQPGITSALVGAKTDQQALQNSLAGKSDLQLQIEQINKLTQLSDAVFYKQK